MIPEGKSFLIYKSVDYSDCNKPNVDSADDQSYTTNRKLSGNQVNLINSYFYNNYIFVNQIMWGVSLM